MRLLLTLLLLTANVFAKPEKADIAFFNAIMAVAKEGYVDELPEENFIYDGLNGALSGMDPHSGYIKPADFAKFKENLSGEFSGLGIQITSENGFIKVIAPIDDTPAKRAGIKSGDYIVKIENENTYQMSVEEASSKMRGKEGTKVNITVMRTGEPAPIKLALMREKIKSKSVTLAEAFDGMYIMRISNFTITTGKEARDAITKIGAPKIKGLILDLRNNPGGVLEQSVIISNIFLKDEKIVSVKGRRPEFFRASEKMGKSSIKAGCYGEKSACEDIKIEQTETETAFFANGRGLLSGNTQLIVLINRGSASAAEIVAGAMKDNSRGLVVGETSFGKGVVQSIIPIKNGENGALKLTTSKYYTPSGLSIQLGGIVPDIIAEELKLEKKENKFDELFAGSERDLKNHTLSERLDDIAKESAKYEKGRESLKNYYDDYQMLLALNLLQSKLKSEKGRN